MSAAGHLKMKERKRVLILNWVEQILVKLINKFICQL